MKYELLTWQELKEDCLYEHDNDGFEYGIHYLDDAGQVIDAEWFKTSIERQSTIDALKG